jgi:DNA-binding response OmpR family regulator
MLTARDTLDDKLVGFEAGADDYLVKPFALQELYVRIQALYKRSHSKTGEVLTVGDLTMDRRTLEVTRSGQNIVLNPACLKILERLMEVSPAVVVRADLETLLWGDDKPETDALRSHFYKLRQAIDRQFGRQLIHTVHRIGYRLAELDDEK